MSMSIKAVTGPPSQRGRVRLFGSLAEGAGPFSPIGWGRGAEPPMVYRIPANIALDWEFGSFLLFDLFEVLVFLFMQLSFKPSHLVFSRLFSNYFSLFLKKNCYLGVHCFSGLQRSLVSGLFRVYPSD